MPPWEGGSEGGSKVLPFVAQENLSIHEGGSDVLCFTSRGLLRKAWGTCRLFEGYCTWLCQSYVGSVYCWLWLCEWEAKFLSFLSCEDCCRNVCCLCTHEAIWEKLEGHAVSLLWRMLYLIMSVVRWVGVLLTLIVCVRSQVLVIPVLRKLWFLLLTNVYGKCAIASGRNASTFFRKLWFLPYECCVWKVCDCLRTKCLYFLPKIVAPAFWLLCMESVQLPQDKMTLFSCKNCCSCLLTTVFGKCLKMP